MPQFQIGDRVVYHMDETYDPDRIYPIGDYGTVICQDDENPQKYWVKWDNGSILSVYTTSDDCTILPDNKIRMVDLREVKSVKLEPGQAFEYEGRIFVVVDNFTDIYAWSLCGQRWLIHDHVDNDDSFFDKVKPVKVTCTIK